MPDETTPAVAQDQGGNNAENTPPANGFQPITINSQEDLDRLYGARVARERAKFSDYDDLKAKAARYDEAVEKGKSEAERERDKRNSAEKERDAARADALRWRIAAKYGLSDEDAELFLTGRDEESITRQAEALKARVAPASAPNLRIDHRGMTPEPLPDKDAQARAFFGL